MKMKRSTRVKTYCRIRDEAVTAAVADGDLAPLKALAKRNGQEIPSDKAMLIAAHKMCQAITTMPEELQEKSRKWLVEHGYRCEV